MKFNVKKSLGVLFAVLPLLAFAQSNTSTNARPSFVPIPASDIPNTPFGDEVRRGEQLFLHTAKLAPQYVGNNLNCVNCHLDAGRQPNSAPLWAAYVVYPAYRAKNAHVNTLAERLQGCFQFSMNGKSPPADDPVIVSLQSYMFWMASKAPTGVFLEGQGFPRLAKPAQAPDYARGQTVYQNNCVTCHGANGEGQRAGDEWVFPPLWGDESFNWGAGMHQLDNASGFIKYNMPLGQGGSLTDQEAWDVAYFMNTHERPQDPRFTGSLEETRKKFHGDMDYYGKKVNGVLLGEHSIQPGGRLRTP